MCLIVCHHATAVVDERLVVFMHGYCVQVCACVCECVRNYVLNGISNQNTNVASVEQRRNEGIDDYRFWLV